MADAKAPPAPEPYRDTTPMLCPHCGATPERWLYQFHLNA
jgi:hypothetical protein